MSAPQRLPSVPSTHASTSAAQHLPPAFPARALPRRAVAGANVTQMHYARRGIVTPEMEFVAIRENQRLDAIRDAALLQQHPGVFGARLTGAGFGGACVALCEKPRAAAIASAVTGRYNRDRLLQLAGVLLPAPDADAEQPQPLFD